MSDASFGPLRIWDGALQHAGRSLDRSADQAGFHSSPLSFAESLAGHEVLRPTVHLREPTEPLSLPWFLELERLRYHRQGRWIPQLLDFAKYRGERLLGLGVSLGSDLVNFASHGVEVLVASPLTEHLGLVQLNFDLRQLPGIFLHADPAALPIETGSIDVVHISGLLHETARPAMLVDEIYRVLKPGGKLLALLPARHEIDPWTRLRHFLRRSRSHTELPPRGQSLLFGGGQFDRGDLRNLLERFQEGRIYRRHLRRADVPHLCRWLPLGMLERLTGRLFLFKGFKPVSAARADLIAA